MPINTLEWITCSHCGINFQIAIPNDTINLYIEPNDEVDYYLDKFGEDFHYTTTHCPKCSKKLHVYLIE